MRQIIFAVPVLFLCTTAFAKTTYEFRYGWDAKGNNDPSTPNTRPYTAAQIEKFLETKKNRKAIETGSQLLDLCGYVIVEKGCHQQGHDRHVTISIPAANRSNQKQLCVAKNTGGSVHVYGC